MDDVGLLVSVGIVSKRRNHHDGFVWPLLDGESGTSKMDATAVGPSRPVAPAVSADLSKVHAARRSRLASRC